jgi:hypothetical protein
MQDEPLKIPWPSFEGVRVPRTVEQVSGVAPKSRVQSVSHQTDTVFGMRLVNQAYCTMLVE